MKIHAFAALTRMTVHALRHYETLGLLVPARLPNGWRDYAPSQAREAVFIAMSREVGFSLAEIARVLPSYRQGQLSLSEMVSLLEQQRREVDAQMAALKAQRQKLCDHIAWLKRQRQEKKVMEKEKANAQKTPRPSRPPWPKTGNTRH